MIFHRSIILISVLFYSLCCKAQDDNYVYKDTAILYADSIAEGTKAPVEEVSAPVENNEDEINEGYIGDTILRDNELVIESDSIRVLKNSKRFAYAKSLDSLLHSTQQRIKSERAPEKRERSWVTSFFLSPVTEYFFWILAGIFVSFILYKLFFAEGFFQRSYAKVAVTELPGENELLSITADYGKLIEQAVSKKNFRLAVRYHYLQSLQKLSSKGAIQFAADKTNYQYVRELSGKAYKNAFASLTLNYEYVWYGEFAVDENVYQAIQNKFKQFNSGV